VVGVLLGQSDGGSDTDARRVAAFALDARGLSEDALSLSRAIEEAIAREELEVESEALRTELARLEVRAERIRAKAESDAGMGDSQMASGAVERGLGQISRTVVVFERDVVERLEPVLDAPPPGEVSDPSVNEALMGVTQVLEEQGDALTALAEDLKDAEMRPDTTFVENAELEEDEVVTGTFDVGLIPSGRTLEIGYEIGDLESDVDRFGVGEAAIATSASGELTLTNIGSRREIIELPAFHVVLYWKEADIPAAALGGVPDQGQSAEDVGGEAIEEPEAETAPEDSDPCEYEIDGDPHCALARLVFNGDPEHARNAAGELVVRPGDGVSLDMIESDDSLIVEARQAGSMAAFIDSHSPDLIQLIAMGFEAKAFQSACLPPSHPEDDTTAGVIVDPYPMTTLGLLASDGEVVFEAEETNRSVSVDSEGEPETPECYTLRAG
jgi:hypothetical protein